MKKLIIVALGVCILGTACSRDTNRIEENTLQQSQEQSVYSKRKQKNLIFPLQKNRV
mgnify:CR=1 FL=1